MIELKAIHRIFNVGDQQVHALNDISLTIRDGEYLSIMGPSGSGKSTLLNLIGLLDQPTSGEYSLNEQKTTTLNDDQQAEVRRNQIGFVFQFFHLIPRLTAMENIELPLVLAGMPVAERRQRVEKILNALGIEDRAHHKPEQLSGGQRQRVAIARATIMQPAVLLADEPTGNLDSTAGDEVVEVLETLNRQGITLIVVTHDAALGTRAQREIKMFDGRIVSDHNGAVQRH